MAFAISRVLLLSSNFDFARQQQRWMGSRTDKMHEIFVQTITSNITIIFIFCFSLSHSLSCLFYSFFASVFHWTMACTAVSIAETYDIFCCCLFCVSCKMMVWPVLSLWESIIYIWTYDSEQYTPLFVSLHFFPLLLKRFEHVHCAYICVRFRASFLTCKKDFWFCSYDCFVCARLWFLFYLVVCACFVCENIYVCLTANMCAWQRGA